MTIIDLTRELPPIDISHEAPQAICKQADAEDKTGEQERAPGIIDPVQAIINARPELTRMSLEDRVQVLEEEFTPLDIDFILHGLEKHFKNVT